ncbi:hypothetical protein DICVIV_01617 [Dictyocaulus viviparus]|uniref:Uncharacterized protein n=1 Tax=Dictyocaulus viviparus TaxID=29172 RepID=A0A0D8Y7H1_DICVI|nr:hypothetical protein DICVIV_01617 [Dictyocaulus viviparus]
MYHHIRQTSMKTRMLTTHTIRQFDYVPQTFEEFQQDSIGWRLYYWMINNARRTDPFGLAQNSISSVDRFARIALPLYFIAVVIVYYNFYVNNPYHFTFND